MSPVERAEYENVSGHVIGIVRINHKGEEHGYALEPEERVWLSEEERRATARAPRDPGENVFGNGHLRKVSESRQTDTDDRPIDAAPAPEPEAQGEDLPADGVERSVAVGGEEPPLKEGALPAPPPAASAPQTRPGEPVATHEEEEQAVKTAERPEDRETGAAVEPQGEPPEGEYAAHEEVATPEAQEIARGPGGAPQRPPAEKSPTGGFVPRSQGEAK